MAKLVKETKAHERAESKKKEKSEGKNDKEMMRAKKLKNVRLQRNYS